MHNRIIVSNFITPSFLFIIIFIPVLVREKHVPEIDISLRERNLDSFATKCGIDCKVEFTQHIEPTIHILDEGPYFKIKRTVTECEE